jgi:hypothetical protein
LAILLLASAALLVVAVVAWAIYLERSLSPTRRAFDPADWRAWGGQKACDSESPRWAMVEDLRSKHLKVGMRKAAVARLLGPQDGHRFPGSLEYGLGTDIDCEFLSLDFDRSGRLKVITVYEG